MLQISHINKQSTAKGISHLEDKVFRRKPVLKYIYKTYGDLPLLEFSKKQFDLPQNLYLSQQRKSEVTTAIADVTGHLLGRSMKESVHDQLKKTHSVITADHHGPLTSAGFFNSNLLLTLNALRRESLDFKNIIILSCANVSFDNNSFPRGHMFHTVKNDESVINQMVLFPRKVRPLAVFRHPSYMQNNIDDAKKRLGELRAGGFIHLQEEDQLIKLLDEVYANAEVLASQTFSEQVTKSNYLLWKKLFNTHKNAPNLIYLEQESIVIKLLRNYHLNQKTIINQILFNPKMHELILQLFNNISGAFSLKQRTGTFLFWGLPRDGKYRTQLWKEGNKLVSPDGTFSVELTPEGIDNALQNKELIPSTLLSFILLSFYYGLTLSGGKYQTTYLSQMKHAYNNLLNMSNSSENPMCSLSVPTDNLCVTSPTLAFLSYARDKYLPATTLDFLLYGGPHYLSAIEEMAQTTTIRQAIARLLPQMYGFLYQKDDMQHITPHHIDKITGFQDQIKPFARIYTK